MDKYNDFLVADFLDDPDFVRWMTNPATGDEDFWTEFQKKYPSKKDDIHEAKLIFNLLRAREDKLVVSEQYELWNNIQHESKSSVKHLLLQVIKYAAILVFAFFSGAVSYYFYQNNSKSSGPGIEEYHVDRDTTNYDIKNGAMLILSDGSRVPLERQLSKIVYDNNGGDVVVNQDTMRQVSALGNESLNKLIVPYGKKSIVVLADGSKVWLNAGSQLIFPAVFSGEIRKVVLKGEAFFDVAKNQDKPFIVETSDQSVHVLGTRFNISAYPEDKFVQTVLEEGKINLKLCNRGFFNKECTIEMEPNQMIEFDKTTKEINRSIVDASKFAAWRNDVLEFNKVDCGKALKQIERFYDIQIALSDPKIATYKLSGKLDLKDNPEDVLNVIKLTVPIAWQKIDNKYFKLYNK
jgi:ferric-dicitrate binding protein FerR (iron transport regulator)